MGEAALAERTVAKQLAPFAFKPGQSGNPLGRPKGSRNKLGEAFIEALHNDFQTHGVAAIQKVRETKPDQYLKVVAAVIPQEVHHTVEDYDQLGDDDLRAAFLSAAGAIQNRIEARGRDRSAGAIEGSAEEVPD